MGERLHSWEVNAFLNIMISPRSQLKSVDLRSVVLSSDLVTDFISKRQSIKYFFIKQ